MNRASVHQDQPAVNTGRALAGLPGVHILRTATWNAVTFEQPRQVLSSAPVNGGEIEASRIINLCVDGPDVRHHCDNPARSFRELALVEDWTGTSVGMMTGVQADRLGIGHDEHEGIAWLVLATLGYSNAHRAGEAPLPAGDGPGTINIIAVSSSALTAAARAEALMLVTETKCAFLADAGIHSVNDRGPATGTGTDAVAIASGTGETACYTGYHTASGPALARATQAALTASLAAREDGD